MGINKTGNPILQSVTKSQLGQQRNLALRQASTKETLIKQHSKEIATLQSQFQTQNTFTTELSELHSEFRKQNAAAEYAGLKVATLPNPGGAIGPGAPMVRPAPTRGGVVGVPQTVPSSMSAVGVGMGATGSYVPHRIGGIVAQPLSAAPSTTGPGPGGMGNRGHHLLPPGNPVNASGGIIPLPSTQSMSSMNATTSALPVLPHQQLPGESVDLTLTTTNNNNNIQQPLSHQQHQQQQQQQPGTQQQQQTLTTTTSAASSAFLEKLSSHLSSFWTEQLSEMRNLGTNAPQTEQDFKNHNDLPLA